MNFDSATCVSIASLSLPFRIRNCRAINYAISMIYQATEEYVNEKCVYLSDNSVELFTHFKQHIPAKNANITVYVLLNVV